MDRFTPAVSVVIPVYNGAETIGACIESLLNQSYPKNAFEIIVVENGSTDQTVGIVQRYPVRLFHSPQRGPAAARNLGISHSSGEIVAFTDADCIAERHWLEELVKPYEQPEIGGVGGSILAYQHPERDIVERFSEEHSPLINFISGDAEFLPHLYTANASYCRSLLTRVNGFNAGLITAEDVDLSWRIQLQTGAKLAYRQEAIIYHHHRSTRAGLARQYRQYGFGEILLDTLYARQPAYPRNLRFQLGRILKQAAALPRYALSMGVRLARWLAGQASREDIEIPRLWFLVESQNILGKLDGLVTTRLMSDPQLVLGAQQHVLIERFFPSRKS